MKKVLVIVLSLVCGIAQASDFSIPPAGLVSIVAPGFFGRGTGPFWGPWTGTEMGYVGILPLVLVSGAVSFTWEILWTRLLVQLLGGSVYAFATMLATPPDPATRTLLRLGAYQIVADSVARSPAFMRS